MQNEIIDLEVNEIKAQQIDSKKSERSLGVYVSPALVWDE